MAKQPEMVVRQYVVVHYLVATGGSGMTRMYLDEVPAWMQTKPGVLIHRIEVLS